MLCFCMKSGVFLEMSLLKLSQRHREIAILSLSGKKVPEIAEEFNMHPWSVYRILEDPKIREYINEIGIFRCKVFINRMFEQDSLLLNR